MARYRLTRPGRQSLGPTARRLRADVQGFLAENTRLTLENQELREVLSGSKTNVIPLRSGPDR